MQFEYIQSDVLTESAKLQLLIAKKAKMVKLKQYKEMFH